MTAAHVGDWLLVPTDVEGRHLRRGQVVALPHPDGTPPYWVRWLDDDHESLLFPPPGARLQGPEGNKKQAAGGDSRAREA